MAASFVFLERDGYYKYFKLCLITQSHTVVETNEFQIPDSGVIVKLRPSTNAVTSRDQLLLVHLVEPAHDIIPVTVEGLTKLSNEQTVLRSNSRSTMLCASLTNFAMTYTSRRFSFWLTVECPWKKEFRILTPDQPADVIIRVGGKDIPTTEAILRAKSDVFAAMFTHDTKEKQTGIVEISDFSFQVVQEMVRFLMHDYCTGWDGQYEKLAAIADKYDIVGMKKLAAEKKVLLDLHP